MDEVEAVARGMWHSLPGAHPWEDLPNNMREAFRKWARPAIAALDACRGTGVIDHMSVVAIAREAGLREAAAHMALTSPSYKREILALIDAGATPGPSQPEPGACVSPDHEGA